MNRTAHAEIDEAVRLPNGSTLLDGDLQAPAGAQGIVLFAHGSGSSRFSPRNQFVAEELHKRRIATLLFDLLTPHEEALDRIAGHLRFDIELLAERLVAATDWVVQQDRLASLPVGYFGASTGGGAALMAAWRRPERVSAVVSRGGRPDLAWDALPEVRSATLLIVGSTDPEVLKLNRQALELLRAQNKELAVVAGASHLFEEPGKLKEVAGLAAQWFVRYLHQLDPAGARHNSR